MITRPPRETIRVAVSSYGMLTVNERVDGKLKGRNFKGARVWLIVNGEGDEATGTMRYGFNDPTHRGRVTWVDAGTVTLATMRKIGRLPSWTIQLDDAGGDGPVSASLMQADCVCGAGAIGNAGPSGEPHYVEPVRADRLPFIQLT